ncbi:MAG: DUF2442 domain-containing protein [Acidimicrobiia bacterium]|nr:DUF2442 domain-containing protein [Acidimicrobiia bacterium]MBT8193217.1 DUF2442 domain-containing protein [Acidimicrobiia bacterium]NNF89082.1 DUF2442 domain-containing protein [Acidimicrobiia bacterium]NNJ46359.1 DUF2442 domain-containing protein [Acidimicrobiia bacterium]NNL12624.1 DUF2442 domain-containing protein [Acidimicrobiia bacterium]
MVDITRVEVGEGRTVSLAFSDGSERVVDLTEWLWGPVFEPIAKDDDLFAQVAVDPEQGTIVWPNGAHFDPEVLHGDYERSQPWKQDRH